MTAWVSYLRTTGNDATGVPIVAKGQDVNTAVDWYLGIRNNGTLAAYINVGGLWLGVDDSSAR